MSQHPVNDASVWIDKQKNGLQEATESLVPEANTSVGDKAVNTIFSGHLIGAGTVASAGKMALSGAQIPVDGLGDTADTLLAAGKLIGKKFDGKVGDYQAAPAPQSVGGGIFGTSSDLLNGASNLADKGLENVVNKKPFSDKLTWGKIGNGVSSIFQLASIPVLGAVKIATGAAANVLEIPATAEQNLALIPKGVGNVLFTDSMVDSAKKGAAEFIKDPKTGKSAWDLNIAKAKAKGEAEGKAAFKKAYDNAMAQANVTKPLAEQTSVIAHEMLTFKDDKTGKAAEKAAEEVIKQIDGSGSVSASKLKKALTGLGMDDYKIDDKEMSYTELKKLGGILQSAVNDFQQHHPNDQTTSGVNNGKASQQKKSK